MLRGLATLVLLLSNLVLGGSPVLVGGLVKLFTWGETRRRVILALASLAERWADGNDRIFDLMLTTKWDVAGLEELRRDAHYLIISNHLSSVDILVLFRVFHRRAPFIRFFLKQELIWFPIVGQGCWALEFPFMKRYSPDYLARHPEKRGKDLETTRRACQRYRRLPVTIANFVEGTRFTREKQSDEESPYRHLLRPRIGGISFVLASLGDQLDSIFDITIAYPGVDITMWDFFCNRVPRVAVRARRFEVPQELVHDDVTEPGPKREALKVWINQIWRDKDDLLESLLGTP
jgi:1-acyl-sn-glycerol-3-phosphate acyltransferase